MKYCRGKTRFLRYLIWQKLPDKIILNLKQKTILWVVQIVTPLEKVLDPLLHKYWR